MARSMLLSGLSLRQAGQEVLKDSSEEAAPRLLHNIGLHVDISA